MKEGIFFEQQTDGVFVKMDRWPKGKRAAQIVVGDAKPFGKYALSEAVRIVEEAIAKGQVRHNYYGVVPAPELKAEEKARLSDLRKRKKAEAEAQEVEENS